MLLQSFFSSYINTNFEVVQQQFISITFLIYIIYYQIHKNSTYSLDDFLNLTLIVSYLIFCILALDYIISAKELHDYTITDAILKYFKNIRVLNHLQTITIPSLALLLLTAKNFKQKSIISIAIFLQFLLLLHTGGRGTIYATESLFIFIFLTNIKSSVSKNTIFLVQAIFIAALLVITILPVVFDNGNSGHVFETSSNGRLDIYKTILPLLLDSKFLFSAIGFSSQDIAVTHFLHPHNILMYIFLGSGTIGMIAFIIFTIYIGLKTLSCYFKKSALEDRYLFAIFGSVFVHSLVSGIYITPLTSLLFIYFLIVFLKRYDIIKRGANKKGNFIVLANSILVITTVGYALLLMKENLDIQKTYQYTQSKKERLYHPGIMLYSDKIYTKEEKQRHQKNMKQSKRGSTTLKKHLRRWPEKMRYTQSTSLMSLLLGMKQER
jgi:O-antigen ligase